MSFHTVSCAVRAGCISFYSQHNTSKRFTSRRVARDARWSKVLVMLSHRIALTLRLGLPVDDSPILSPWRSPCLCFGRLFSASLYSTTGQKNTKQSVFAPALESEQSSRFNYAIVNRIRFPYDLYQYSH